MNATSGSSATSRTNAISRTLPTEEPSSAATSLPPWRRLAGSLRPELLVLAGLPLLFYWRLWAPGSLRRWFPDGDFVDQFFAFTTFEVRSFSEGRLPLWNPYAYAGSPFWADVQAAVAYPISLAGSLASAIVLGRPSFLALELEAVAHVSIAMVLTFVYARRVTGSSPAAAIAAATFGFGGYLAGYPLLQLAIVESVAWLPLALLGVELLATTHSNGEARASTGRSTSTGVAALAAGIGLSVLAGHPQSAMYVIYVTVIYALWRLRPWRGLLTPARPAPTSQEPYNAEPRALSGRLRRGNVLPLGAAALLAAGLSAAGWLPAAQYMALSNRAAIPYSAVASGFPPRELFGLVVPGLTHWSPLYVGVVPLLLAVGAALSAVGVRRADPRLDRVLSLGGFWVAVAAVALVVSLGGATPLYDVLYLVAPGFDTFRGQERAALIVSFGLAQAASAGWVLLTGADATATDTAADGGAGTAADGGAGTAADGGAGTAADGAADPDLVSRQQALVRSAMANGSLVVALAAVAALTVAGSATPAAALVGAGTAAVLAGTVGSHRREKIRERLSLPSVASVDRGIAIAVASLLIMELYLAVGTVNLASEPPAELDANPAIVLLAEFPEGRVANEYRLPPNFGVLHGIESTSGASPLWPAAFGRLRDALEDQPERLHQLLAVSNVLTWQPEISGAGAPLIVWEGESGADAQGTSYLHLLSEPSPPVWRVARSRAVTDADAISALQSPDFDPLAEVLIHSDDPGLTREHALGRAGFALLERRPGYAAVATEGDAPGWLVFSEIHYPGWQARIDDAAAPVHRADVALMAVEVPEGTHRVELVFDSALVRIGLLLTAISAALCVLLLLSGAQRPRRSSPPP